MAQKPFIKKISPNRGEVGQKVIISGSNLGNVTQVYFGGVLTSPAVAPTAKIVEVLVPAGATHSEITVITSTNLSAESSEQFFIDYGGGTINDYRAQLLISSGETNLNTLCMCDLDGDGLNDLVGAHTYTTSTLEDEITIYRNTTTNTANQSFAPPTRINNATNNQGFGSVFCGDINNDGRPELFLTADSQNFPNDLYIYQNNSTSGSISLSLVAGNIKLPQTDAGDNRSPGRGIIADIDGDGNPDLIVGNSEDGTIHVYTGNGDFSFDPPTEVAVGSAITTGALEVADFDRDGKPDVAVLPFRTANEQIYLLRNRSQPGTVLFSLENGITSPSRRINIVSGDFDGDGYIDLAATNQDLNRIEIFRNTSSGRTITFGTLQPFAIAGTGVWGMDLGDMNGDGQLDIVVGSTDTQNQLNVLPNTSTSGNINFGSAISISATSNNQNVAVGDLNGDSKPDIAFTHNVNIASGLPGNMGVFVNDNCVFPEIVPDGLEVCVGDAFSVTTNRTVGGPPDTYSWSVISGDASFSNNAIRNPDITINSGGSATVEVIIKQDNCTQSTEATFTVAGGGAPVPTTITNSVNETCAGEAFEIIATAGNNIYEWTLPDGSITTTNNNVLSVGDGSPSLSDNGAYRVRAALTGGCFTNLSPEFILIVNQPPVFDIINNGNDAFCASSTTNLSVPNFPADFQYQWRRNGTDIGGATSANLDVSQSGNYSVVVTEQPGGDGACSVATEAYNVTAVNLPSSVINEANVGVVETCQNFETSFTAGSTGEAGYDLTYSWEVDGVVQSTTSELLYTFPNVQSYEVRLTTSYNPDQVTACSDVEVITVNVNSAPTITFDQTDFTAKCQAESITIGLTLPITADIDSIIWRTAHDATGSANDTLLTTANFSGYTSLDVSPTNMPVGVDSVYVIATVFTNIGCEVTDTVRIRNFPSDIAINAPSYTIVDGAITLEEANFLTLDAQNVSSVTWSSEAGDIFSAANGLSTTVFPNQPTTVVTLTGTDENSCLVSTEVTILLDNVRPRRTFSPNGDGLGFDCWEILNTSELQGCKVYVFDARGRNILVADSPFTDNCVWDGNFNGSPVPEGVYYYVLKCSDDNLSKSGSILLAR